jgi:hypothetical protein
MEQKSSEMILKPVVLKDILILAPGRWNNVDYTELEIMKAFNNTDWNDRKFTSLYLDHQDTKERGVGNWVGYVKNRRLENSSLYGDLEIWNPMIGAFLSQAKAKFGISATLAGRENKREGKMEDFHFESFSIVTDPACKPAMINLSNVNMVQNSDVKIVTMENEVKENLVELETEELILAGRKNAKTSEEIAKGSKVEKEHKDTYDELCSYFKENEGKLPSFEEFTKMIAKDHVAEDKQYYEKLDEANLQNEGSAHTAHTLEPIKYEKLDAKFERQVSHIKDSLKKAHPDWDEKKIESIAYATANKMKSENQELEDKELEELAKVTAFEEIRKEKGMSPSEFYAVPRDPPSSSSLPIFDAAHVRNAIARFNQTHLSPSEKTHAWSAIVRAAKRFEIEVSSKENSEIQDLKGGINMPEIMENESKVVLEDEKAKEKEVEKETEKKEDEKKEDKKEPEKEESKKEEKKEDEKKALSDKETILNKVKEMSAEELVAYTNFIKTYLSEHKDASAKEVTLAFENSKVDKELSASELLASIDSRIASLRELDSSKKMQEMEAKIQELSAKVKTPDRKTLSVAFDSSTDSNLGMLNFLQHRID